MNELDALRQEAETLKNAIRVSLLLCCFVCVCARLSVRACLIWGVFPAIWQRGGGRTDGYWSRKPRLLSVWLLRKRGTTKTTTIIASLKTIELIVVRAIIIFRLGHVLHSSAPVIGGWGEASSFICCFNRSFFVVVEWSFGPDELTTSFVSRACVGCKEGGVWHLTGAGDSLTWTNR